MKKSTVRDLLIIVFWLDCFGGVLSALAMWGNPTSAWGNSPASSNDVVSVVCCLAILFFIALASGFGLLFLRIAELREEVALKVNVTVMPLGNHPDFRPAGQESATVPPSP